MTTIASVRADVSPPPAPVNNFGDTRAGDGLAGPMSLVIILVLAIATVLLIRNMNKRLKRLPEKFADSVEVPERVGNQD